MSDFILVRHDATRRGLHWDLRWKEPTSKNWVSFAFKKFPPTKVGERVYIVRTTQHSESQALFLGKIPEGEYGAGTLSKEDSGSCDVLRYTNAHMIVDFHGKKLKGKYHIIATGVFGGKHDYTKKTYVFFKAKEDVLEATAFPKMWKETITKMKKVGKLGVVAITAITVAPLVVKILRTLIRSLSLCNRVCEVVDIKSSKLTIEDRACIRRCRIRILQKGIENLNSLKNKCADQECKNRIDSKIEILKNKINDEQEALSYLGAK